MKQWNVSTFCSVICGLAMWLLQALPASADPTNTIGFPVASSCATKSPPINTGSDPALRGAWWNPNRYGTGWDFFFTPDNTQIVVYWYTFNGNGQPIWLIGGSNTAQTDSTGAKQFWAPLYLITKDPVSGAMANSQAGEVSITFVPGSSTAAALRWHWNAVPGGANYDECVYTLSHPSGSGTSTGGSTSSVSNVDESYTGAWYDPTQSGWGLDLDVATDTLGTTSETDKALIYDSAGQPVWLYGVITNPPTTTASTSLIYAKSVYGFPTVNCTNGAPGVCVSQSARGTVSRSFSTSTSGGTNTITGSVTISAVVPASVTGGAAVNWPNATITYPSTIYELGNGDYVAVNQTSCSIPAGQSTCAVSVSWTSTKSTASIYRRNLVDNVLSSSALAGGSMGQYTDQLSAGADVQYELRNGGSAGTLLYTSPEVIVPAAQGNTTPVSATPNVAAVPTTTDTISDAVGATIAQFRVDEGGNATYSVPIQVSPGTAGMVPKLSLGYNSRSPNGVMGPGWSIQGSSMITRCRQAREAGDFYGSTFPDGNPQPVDFQPQDDRFCLDGVRLLRLSTSSAQYGQNGSLYSPENDPATLVTATVSNYSQGPDSFTVQRKDGTTSTYGYTVSLAANAARPTATVSVAGTATTVAVSWNLARVQDTTGNYIDYIYTNQPGASGAGALPFASGAVESVLAKVNYSGHLTSPVSAPYASVTFAYNTLVPGDPGIRLGYQAGVPFLQSQQLRSVAVVDGGTKVRYYQLAYQTSPSGSGFQELASLKECQASNQQVCYPPTVFTWSAANYSIVADTTQTQSSPTFASMVGFKVADVDGDGRQDLVWAKDGDASCTNTSRIYVSFLDRNTTTNQLTLVTPTQDVRCAPIDLKNYDGAWYLFDYDGDGRADLLIGGSIGGYWQLYLSKGRPATSGPVFDTCDQFDPNSTCSTHKLTTAIPVASFLLPDGSASKGASALLADLNGDGLPDLIYPSAASAASDNTVVQARLMTRQVNGSFAFSDPYAVVLNVTDGHCSTTPTTTCTFNFFNGDTQHRSAIVSDINGDGRADLTMYISAYTDIPRSPCQKLPSGGQITFDPTAAVNGSRTSSSSVAHTDYWYQFTAAGVSQPAGYPIPLITLNEYWSAPTSSSGGALPVAASGMYVADVNGDGLADIIYQDVSNPSLIKVMINTGKGYLPAMSFTASPALSGDNGLQLVDINGDGRLDIAFRTSATAFGYVSVVPSGAGWAFSTQQAVAGSFTGGVGWISLFGDIDGDAVPDYLAVQVTSGSFYTARVASSSRYKVHDTITTFTNGLGASTTLNYQAMTNNAVYLSRTTAGASAYYGATWGYGSPVFTILAPMYLVESAASVAPAAPGATPQQNNPAAQSVVYYQYQQARMQAGGRGLLGFKSITTYDGNDVARTGQYVVTTTSYVQAYPFIGMPFSASRVVRTGPYTSGSTTIDTCAVNGPESAAGCFGTIVYPGMPGIAATTSVSQYSCIGTQCTPPASSTCVVLSPQVATFTPNANPQPIFSFVTSTTDTQYDIVSGATTSQSSNYLCYDNPALARTNNTDTNLTTSVTVTRDANNTTVESKTTTNTYYNDTSAWYLGRLLSASVQFVRPNVASKTRTSNFCYDLTANTSNGALSPTCSTAPSTGLNTGLLVEERVERGLDNAGTSTYLDLRTLYTLDAYGNRTGAYQCSADLSDANCLSPSGAAQRQSGMQVHRYAKTAFDSIGRYSTSSSMPFLGAAGALDERAAVTTNLRDLFGNPVQQTSVDGLVQYAKFGALGRPYFTSDNTGKASTTTYRLCSSVSCPADAIFRSQTVTAGAPTAWTYYDLLGRPVMTAAQTFDANPLSQSYSAACTFYDSHNRPVFQSEPFFLAANIGADGSPGITNTTQCRSTPYGTKTYYDVLGRVVQIVDPDGGIINKTYSGLVTTSSNPRNGTWLITETRNALGELAASQDAVDGTDAATGLTVTQLYDAMGDLLSVSRTTTAGGTITSSMTYDDLGRKRQLTDPDAGTSTIVYNAAGDVISTTDAKSQTIASSYDAMGRRWQRSAGGFTDTWNYDYFSGPCYTTHGCGMLMSETRTPTSGAQFNRSMAYDAFGRMYQRNTSFNGYAYSETSAYDQFGRLLAQQDATGYSLFPEYSPNGFIGKQVDTRTGAVYRILGTDARGHVTSDQRGDSIALVSSIGYDPNTGRISSVCAGNSCNLQYLSYTFDVAGNLTQRGRNVVMAPTIEQFTYDALNRLKSGQLTRINGTYQTATTATLAYDQLGNLCSKNGKTYLYGPQSGCATHAAAGGPHEVMSVGAVAYGYDADGNQTTGAGRTLVYDVLNELTSASAGGTSTTFQYSPDGDRYMRVDSNGTTTHYIGSVEIKITASLTERQRYLAGAAIDYVRSNSNNETRYLFSDHLGSTDTIVNSQGAIIEQVSFDVHGSLRNPITWNGAAAVPTSTTHGFTGHEEMYSLGLTHMNGRIYDPSLGRMLQADPLTGPGNQSLNRYSYVVNNPLSLTDPTGYSWWRDIAAIAIVVFAPELAPSLFAEYELAATVATGFIAGIVQSDHLSGGIYGAFSAGLFYEAGQYFDNAEWAHTDGNIGATKLNIPGFSAKILAHGVVGGVMSSLQGGKFGAGFISAGAGEAAGPWIDGLDPAHPIGQYVSAERVVAAAVIGGTTSFITGGKFGNGAVTAAFGRAFNEESKVLRAKRQFPPFEKLKENYPARNDDGSAAHPSKDAYPNQCAIRLGFDLIASGEDLSSYTDHETSEGYPRGSQALTDWITRNYGAPTETTIDYFHNNVYSTQQGIFVEYAWNAENGHWETYHIDIFYQGNFGSSYHGQSEPIQTAKIAYWIIK